MLSINWSDVINVITQIAPYLVGIGIALIAAIVVTVVAMKAPKNTKGLIRGSAWVAAVLVVLIMVNLICTGPMSTLLTSVAGKPVSKIDAATTQAASDLCVDIAEEGIVLLQNDDNLLPLAKDSNVNLFGWDSVFPVYGGTGSGALNDAYHTVTLIEGLENAGFKVNSDLVDFYTAYRGERPSVGMWAQDWTLPEPPASTYSSELIDGAKAFSDVAVIVVGRPGGENADLPTDGAALIDGSWNDGTMYHNSTFTNNSTEYDEFAPGEHYLELTQSERDMVELVCSNFDNVVLVVNAANTMELGFVDDYAQIKSVLWCPGPGQNGFNGLGTVLNGTVNPSGRSVDTFLYDLTATPLWNNTVPSIYDNMGEYDVALNMFGMESTEKVAFINYVEGIYVGYKFYETAATEGLIDYDKTVQYPFGHGLSYTSFQQEITSFSNDGTNINMTVRVSNTGSVAGKDVVEVYFNPPYTNGGIEKASANLVEFAKTGVIEPGASQDVTISFPIEQMASYDYIGHGCYVLEKGDYVISVNADSHTVLDSETFTQGSDVVYDENNKRESDATPAVNRFDFVQGDATYLSRKDGFANYDAATAAPASLTMSADDKANFYNNSNYLTAEAVAADEERMFPDAVAPTTGKSGSLKLIDLRGADYDDPRWDELLDQLTLDQMGDLIALGGYQTLAIDSIGKYRTNDCDGPASINNNFTGQGSVGFPSAVMIASTWSDELAMAFGESIGEMADQMDTAGWYAPAMNTHRSAFAGRNFEYYSEDGVLAGSMAANATIGAEKHGVYAYIKHFAFNDCEDRRTDMLCTWSNEQAMREIYLKPFEIAVKEGKAKAVMSSFNYIGPRWAGGCYELQTEVLRDEWGFQGMVLTDYFGVYGYMSADQAIRTGTDFCLVNYPTETSQVRFRETPAAQQAMRQSTKNILYVTVNSRQYSELGIQQSTQPNRWETYLTVANVVVGVVLVAAEAFFIYSFLKKKKSA